VSLTVYCPCDTSPAVAHASGLPLRSFQSSGVCAFRGPPKDCRPDPDLDLSTLPTMLGKAIAEPQRQKEGEVQYSAQTATHWARKVAQNAAQDNTPPTPRSSRQHYWTACAYNLCQSRCMSPSFVGIDRSPTSPRHSRRRSGSTRTTGHTEPEVYGLRHSSESLQLSVHPRVHSDFPSRRSRSMAFQ
jgi:hypothetical protein